MRVPFTFLVDPSHHHCVYGSYFYHLIARCRAFKKNNCEVLIRNFGYAMKQNHGKPKDVFKTAMNAGLYHQFNSMIMFIVLVNGANMSLFLLNCGMKSMQSITINCITKCLMN